MELKRAGSQPSVKGPTDWFTGTVRIDPLHASPAPSRVSCASVTFEPGARSAWHTHPLGQTLIVTAGCGWTQCEGEAIVEIRAGDVIWCPPGHKHWHGATATTAMTHIAIQEALDGRNVVWMEKVSDAQYLAAPPPGQDDKGHIHREVTIPRPTADTLSVKQQAIIPVAAFAAAGDIPRLSAALNDGLEAGLTVNDLKEVLVQLYAYAGFPRSLNALGELKKTVDGRRQRGLQDAEGQPPTGAIPTGDALRSAGAANQAQLSGAPVSGALFDFAPAIGEYLKTHLFGDIFERDNLDWQSREVATVSMLSALQGVDSQLQSHLRISMNVGLTAAQLSQVVTVLADRVDSGAATRAGDALARHRAGMPPM